MTAILSLRGLGKDYGDRRAVDAVDLEVAAGTIVGLLGPNGAGKTTTILMASGVITPTRGTAHVDGHDVWQAPRKAKRALGLVPQELALYEDLSARQNLVYFGRLYGLAGPELDGRIAWALDLAGLADRATEPVDRFSGGMKRRLNLVAGILHQPRLLVLDEPTVGVDPQSRNHIFETVRRLRTEGVTVLYTSHYMEEVEMLCDRVAIMDHGAVVASGTITDLIATHGGDGIDVEVEGDAAAARAAAAAHASPVGGNGAIVGLPAVKPLAPALAAIEATGDDPRDLEPARQPRGRIPEPDRQGAAGRRMIGAAIKKDVQLLLRDRVALASLFVLPILFIVAFGLFFKIGPERGEPRPIAVWHAQGDALGARVVAALAAADAFVPEFAASAEAVRGRVAREDVIAGLVVPPDFAPGARPVELVIDLTMAIQARGPIQGALTGLATRAVVGPPPGAAEPVFVVARSPPGLAVPPAMSSSFQVTVPGNAVLFGFFIAMTVAIGFAEERRSGTWRRALASPVPRGRLLVAKLVPYILIGIVQLGFLFGVGAVAFGMQVAGSVVGLVALSVAVVACATALGLLLATVGKSEKAIGAFAPPVLLVMGMLGGCMFPRLLMPEVMQTVGLAVPHAWALDGYHALLVRPGTTVVDVLPQIGAILGFAVVFAGLGLARFRFER